MAVNLKGIESLSPAELTDHNWWVARHEAAHFVAGVYFGFPILRVWLAVRKNREGRLGLVRILDEPTRGWLLSTAVGPVADIKMLGYSQCKQDGGFWHELGELRENVSAAMQNRYYEDFYLGGRVPTHQEVLTSMKSLIREAQELIEKLWQVIKEVAILFLSNRNMSTGEIHPKKIDAIVDRTRRMINFSGSD